VDSKACLTSAITKFIVSRRSDLDAGEGGKGRRNAPMDGAMDRATAATHTAAETAGTTIFQQMERNKNGDRRVRSEAPAAPSD
jgi:hypothetical protein